MARYLSPEAARRFYDRIGRLEDTQAFYEDPALAVLIDEGGFGTAQCVMEFGCGTGRLAERLLSALPPDARYAACDLSGRMVELARSRLSRFGDRVTVWQCGPAPDFAPGHPPFDRIVTSYVLDLLPPEGIAAVLAAARATLSPGGRFCAASITDGAGFPASWLSTAWRGLYRLSPGLVGGCCPIRLAGFFADGWSIQTDARVDPWAVTSEIVIATPA